MALHSCVLLLLSSDASPRVEGPYRTPESRMQTVMSSFCSALESLHAPFPRPQVGSLTLMLLLLFGGFLLNKESVPGYCAWLSRASFFNYAYEVRHFGGKPRWGGEC